MNAKHTQGEWEVIERGNTYHTFVVWAKDGDAHSKICEMAAHNSEANAQLIAAAPDLLAALELPFKYEKVFNEGGGKASDALLKTYGWDERCSPETFMQEVARAAISKATGA